MRNDFKQKIFTLGLMAILTVVCAMLAFLIVQILGMRNCESQNISQPMDHAAWVLTL